jgi:hypothetical protein
MIYAMLLGGYCIVVTLIGCLVYIDKKGNR